LVKAAEKITGTRASEFCNASKKAAIVRVKGAMSWAELARTIGVESSVESPRLAVGERRREESRESRRLVERISNELQEGKQGEPGDGRRNRSRSREKSQITCQAPKPEFRVF
jgi:hypothetical protein